MDCDEHHVLIETVRWCIYVSQSLISLRSYATLTEEDQRHVRIISFIWETRLRLILHHVVLCLLKLQG